MLSDREWTKDRRDPEALDEAARNHDVQVFCTLHRKYITQPAAHPVARREGAGRGRAKHDIQIVEIDAYRCG